MNRVLLLIFCLAALPSIAQKRYTVETGTLSFFSDGVIEDIEAVSESVTSIVNADKGDIAFLARIKDFQFEKKLMQVHFNEKFMESEKYPKSTFMGQIAGFDPAKPGVQQVVASGKLTIHGVTRDIRVPGTLENRGSNLVLKSSFKVRLSDYNIHIPQIVWQNIAEEVVVKLDFVYRSL